MKSQTMLDKDEYEIKLREFQEFKVLRKKINKYFVGLMLIISGNFFITIGYIDYVTLHTYTKPMLILSSILSSISFIAVLIGIIICFSNI